MKLIETNVFINKDEATLINDFRHKLREHKDEVFTVYVPRYIERMIDEKLDDGYESLIDVVDNKVHISIIEHLKLFVSSSWDREEVAMVASHLMSIDDGRAIKNVLDNIVDVERRINRLSMFVGPGQFIENKWITEMINVVPLDNSTCHNIILDEVSDETGEITKMRVIFHSDILTSFIDQITEYMDKNPMCSSKFWIFRRKLIQIRNRVTDEEDWVRAYEANRNKNNQ